MLILTKYNCYINLSNEIIHIAFNFFQLRLYTHMYGSQVGDFNVYTRVTSNGPMKNVLHLHGNKGDQWVRQIIPLSEVSDFQVSRLQYFFYCYCL